MGENKTFRKGSEGFLGTFKAIGKREETVNVTGSLLHQMKPQNMSFREGQSYRGGTCVSVLTKKREKLPNVELLLLLLLSHFSHVRLCATPQTVAHQAPPSLGFSRQEHWSELPFPSPMYESEK